MTSCIDTGHQVSYDDLRLTLIVSLLALELATAVVEKILIHEEQRNDAARIRVSLKLLPISKPPNIEAWSSVGTIGTQTGVTAVVC